MAENKIGASGIFWITFILLGLIILIGIFYWMVAKPNRVPHSPERPNGAVWRPLPLAGKAVA